MNKLDALAALRGSFPILEAGHVWLAGAGPGDPGLLTLDAVAGLAQADVIVHDALVDKRVLALAGPHAEFEYAGKRGGRPSALQADISRRLVELARERKKVLRLKGGDPCMFGRGGEEAIALAEAGIPYRIISGVTAGLSALSAASIPATMRGINHAIIFATGHADGDFDWAALARTGQPIVIYMAMRNVEQIVEALLQGGLAPQTPAAVIIAATTPEQRIAISRLDRVVDAVRNIGFSLPGLIVIGDIVNERDRLLKTAAEAEAVR
jgi:uroporphyrin-III C-methyltransferase